MGNTLNTQLKAKLERCARNQNAMMRELTATRRILNAHSNHMLAFKAELRSMNANITAEDNTGEIRAELELMRSERVALTRENNDLQKQIQRLQPREDD